jgi:hypothetical protein
VNATEATSKTTYRLAMPGRHGSFTARNARIINLKRETIDNTDEVVTLIPNAPFGLAKPVHIKIFGNGLGAVHDSLGRFIDGDSNGVAGGDAIALAGRKG